MIELGSERNQDESRSSNRGQPVQSQALRFRGMTRARFFAAIV